MIKNMKKLIDGFEVEWKPLSQKENGVAELSRGRVMSKIYLAENEGSYPVYSSQTANGGEIGKIKTYDYDGEYITWTTDGANAGTVFYRKGKFSITNVCGLIKIKNDNELNYKFLFYWLSIEAKKHVYSGMGNPKLMNNQMEKILIPIPCPRNPEKSLKIQTGIVRKLDSLTELTVGLTAELTAELTARKKQYEYYRDKLLTFDDSVEWKEFNSIGTLIRGNGLQKKDFSESGVGCIHYGQIYTYFGLSAEETKSFVKPELAKKLRKVNTNDIIITCTSENFDDVCTPVVWLGKDEIVTGGHAMILKHNENPKYIAYYLKTTMFNIEKRKHAIGTKVIDVSTTMFGKIKIPLPPLHEQERIVKILDKFDALMNDISKSLCSEIEARQKQYQYYRDIFLSFPKD